MARSRDMPARAVKAPLPKLVRDLVPDVIKQQGGSPKYEVLHDDRVYLKALNDKLFEEVREYEESFAVEELADVVEVVEALSELLEKVAPGELRKIREEKRALKGGFTARILLTTM